MINVLANATLNLFDKADNSGKITGGHAGDSGGGVLVQNGTFVMNGGKITGNTIDSQTGNWANCGGGVALVSGVFTMNDGVISNNVGGNYWSGSYQYHKGGGGVGVIGGSFTMNSGEIYGNQAYNGGGIYLHNNITPVINGGNIHDNSAYASGGAVYAIGQVNLYVKGGKIYNNSAPMCGGIWLTWRTVSGYKRGATVHVSDGEMYGNHSNGLNGAIGCNTNASFYLSGSPSFHDNTYGANNTECNIYLVSGRTIGLEGALGVNAHIGITTAAKPTTTSNVVFTNGLNGKGLPTNFYSDIDGYGVMPTASGEAQLVVKYSVTYDSNGATSGNVPSDSNSPYVSGSSVTVLGNTGNLTRTGFVFAGWNTKADGSGTNTYHAGNTFTIEAGTTLYAKWVEAVASVTNGGVTTYYDVFTDALTAWTNGTTLTLLQNVNYNSSQISIYDTKTLNTNGKTLTCNDLSVPFILVASGTLTVTGNGTISKINGNDRTITVQSGAALVIDGPTIKRDRIGAVIGGSGTITLTNGSVINTGTTDKNNAFSIQNGAVLNLNGGRVECNNIGTDMSDSSAILTAANSSVTINLSGTTILSNAGYGIYARGTDTVNISGGSITCSAGNYAVGIKNSTTKLNVTGSPTISNNGKSIKFETANAKLNLTATPSVNMGIIIGSGDSGVFTNSTNTTYNDSTKFTSDDPNYAVGKNAAGQLYLGAACKVTYDSNGATSGSVPSDTNSPYASGSTVTVLSKGTLTKNGYSFAGWKMGDKTYANSSDGISGTETSFTITGNSTLTAQWTPIDATAPTISSQPQNLNLTYGYTAGSVNVTATAATDTTYGNLAYQWYSNTTASNTGGTAITENGTSSTYTVPTGKNAGITEYYYCVITATRSDNSQTAMATSNVATVTINRLNETAPTNDEAKAQLNIDYQNETISTNPGYEFAADNHGTQIANFSSILDDVTPTVCVRKGATNINHAPSDWVEVTLAARPAEPTGLGSTSATSGSSADGTITGVDNTMEYFSGTSWHDVTGTTITGLNPGSYSVRVKATDSAPHGVATTVDVGNGFVTLSEANKPTISLPNSHTVPIVGDTLTASTSASNVTYQWYVNGIAIPNATDATYTVRAEDYDKTIYVEAIQNMDSSGTNLTMPITKPSATTAAVVKKNNSSAPTNVSETGFSPNYLAETFTVGDSYEVASANIETALITNGSLTNALDGTGKVYIRKKETDDTIAGAWLEVTLVSRPAEPTGLESTKATSDSSADGTITGVLNTMEYSSDGTSWNDVTGDAITGLNPGSYSVRVRATDNAPHGKATVVTVGNKEVINLTDTQKPTAKTNLAVKSTFQKLVDAPVDPLPQGATEIQYALGTDAVTPPTSGWSTSIPEGKDEGTYFVWYKVIGSANYLDTVPVCIQVTISVYKYTKGDGSTWTKNSGLSLYFEIKNTVNDINTFSNFREISVDDRQYVDHDNYDAESGSVQITLKAAYLETLAVGEHKLTAYFDGDYTADAKFTVLESPVDPDSLPRTGDKSNVLIYAIAGIVALAGLVLIAKRKRI